MAGVGLIAIFFMYMGFGLILLGRKIDKVHRRGVALVLGEKNKESPPKRFDI